VDDDEVALRTYAAALAAEGYLVRTAATAATGWQELERSTPAAILLDLRLPAASDGLQLLREIRARDGDATPIAIVTGEYGLDECVEAEILRLGARLAFKPLWIDGLVELVAALVRRDSSVSER
jgi:DNA-binding response OmpR family regulator